jgi:microsomal dipeptidase-like Zn-dependent dipeptidase
MSAVDFHMLCDLMPESNRRPGQSCGGMRNIDLQLQMAWEFVKERDWVSIVTSPEELRNIVSEGKLAMILAIEVSDLFGLEHCTSNCTWIDKLDHYYNLGVRSIQVVHELDNMFGGAALHHWMFQLFEFIDKKYPFRTDSQGRNLLGLTDEGRKLVQEFINRKMFVDIAHLSERGNIP